VNCDRCGHPYSLHVLTDERCRMRIGYNWDAKTCTFGSIAPCRCPGYRGVRPYVGECPHEYTKESKTCVHCGHVLARWEKRVR
jgi:hypothetical protein